MVVPRMIPRRLYNMLVFFKETKLHASYFPGTQLMWVLAHILRVLWKVGWMVFCWGKRIKEHLGETDTGEKTLC